MIRKKRRNLLARVFSSPVILTLAGLAIIVLISFPIVRNASQRHRIDSEIKELEEDIKMIKGKNTELLQLLDYLESDEFVEEQARLNFGLKKEGEKVAVIQPDNAEGQEDNGESGLPNNGASIYNIPGLDNVQPDRPVNNPQKWWRYFFE